jgi:hypothetical protein
LKKENILDPSYHARICTADFRSAQSIEIFLSFLQVLYQNETTSGSQVSKIRFSSKSTHSNVYGHYMKKVGREKRVRGGRYCSAKFARLGSLGSAGQPP